MFLLKIIAAVVAAFILFALIEGFNAYTQRKANYRFFREESFFYYAGSYVLLYAGYSMIESHWHGDPLNGIIVSLIGLVLLGKSIRDNFRSVPFRLALGGTLLQLLLYIPATVLAMLALALAIAGVSGIKPTYCLNGRD